MTIHKLRNLITVIHWGLSDKGALISYKRIDKGDNLINYLVPPNDLIAGLNAMASIDDYVPGRPITVSLDGCFYTFDSFIRNYHLSQWEAINLIVRHEAEMEEARTMDLLEMDTALKAIFES